MSLVGGTALGMGPAGAFRFAQTRGRIQGGSYPGLTYPSPFFDVAHTYLPTTVKQMFRWCRYYFLTNPLINATVFKLAEYPITDIVIEHDSQEVSAKWMEFLQDQLRYRSFQVEVGLDFFVYGNAFVSVYYPFQKQLKCASCGHTDSAAALRNRWTFTNYAFRLNCPSCGTIANAFSTDVPIRSARDIRLVRWNPEDIDVTYNEITGDFVYYYNIPPAIRNDIVIGRKEVVEKVPDIFIRALKEQKSVVFSPDKVYHLRRPTLATQDRGWGIPLLLAVLKDAFYMQLMKKAQETILIEHVIPLRVLFPQAASGTSDPFSSIPLVDWKEHIASEIARWRFDPNYIPILPLPIGTQSIGGEGKSLLLTAELQAAAEGLIMGMGVPKEFLMGGLSYAGTNVSLRMLENSFLGYILRHKHLLRFIIQEVQAYMQWPLVDSRFKPFKMADDVQQKAMMLQLNQANKVSDTTTLGLFDISQEDENSLMIHETARRLNATKKQQLAMAEIQGSAQMVMSKFQAKAQQAMMEAQQSPQAPGEPGGPEAGLAAGAPGPGGAPMTGETPPPAALQQPTAEQQPASPAGVSGTGAPGALPSMTTPSEDFHQLIQSGLSGSSRIQEGHMGVDLPSLAAMYARQMSTMAPDMRELAIQNLASQSPELADLVRNLLAMMGTTASSGSNSKGVGVPVDGRPLPEQRAPRRQTGG